MFFLKWGAHNWTQYSMCVLTSESAEAQSSWLMITTDSDFSLPPFAFPLPVCSTCGLVERNLCLHPDDPGPMTHTHTHTSSTGNVSPKKILAEHECKLKMAVSYCLLLKYWRCKQLYSLTPRSLQMPSHMKTLLISAPSSFSDLCSRGAPKVTICL